MIPSLVAGVLIRDLRALRREIEAYPSDADLWRVAPGITNTGGNLALHLAGNLQHFIGKVLGHTGYVRNRDAEFKSRDVPRAQLLAEIDRTVAAVETGLARLENQDLSVDFPEPLAGRRVSTADALLHLLTHCAYHLGQVDYHRRLITGQATTVGAMAPGELRSVK
jgi:DinB family protein